MLEDLRKYENLGTPKFYFELFSVLKSTLDDNWTEINIQKYFHNRVIDGRAVFDGCIPLSESLGIILIDEENKLSLDDSFSKFLRSEKYMTDRFLEKLFITLSNNDIFFKIFSSKNLSYDVIYHSIQINNSAFSFKFSNFKQLLIDFGVLNTHPSKTIKKFIINSRYKKLFDKVILPEIKKRKIGIEELRKSLEQNNIYGEEAEIFVLEYERKRLNNKEGIEWVAEYSVAEGYDVISFNDESSTTNDRFIEVKSYEGTPQFYWSRNEIDVARIKKDHYFLYLVDRKHMDQDKYIPIVIRNPYTEVVINNDKWDKTIEKYKVILKN